MEIDAENAIFDLKIMLLRKRLFIHKFESAAHAALHVLIAEGTA